MPRSSRFLLAVLLPAAAGCSVIEDFFDGDGSGRADRHELQSLALESDHPENPGDPGGAAVATNGALVRFTAVGSFINLDENDEPSTRDVTGSVLWRSSDPTRLLPGSDGRVLVTSTGSFTISVATPAAGDVPALESNEIVLTVLTAGTGT